MPSANIHAGGGAIMANSKSILSIGDCKFLNNTSCCYGGAIRVEDNVKFLLKDSKFQFNKAYQGGAIFCTFDVHASISWSKFEENEGSEVKYKGCYSCGINSKPQTEAGAIQARTNVTIYVWFTMFLRNKAYFGSAIGCSAYATLYLMSVTFKGNIAENMGVVDTQMHTHVEIQNATFYNNSGQFSIIAIGPNVTHTISDCNFESNKGGIIFATRSKVKIGNSTFSSNMIHDINGCIITAVGADILVSNSLFRNNSAYSGGVAKIQGSNSFRVISSVFDGNFAEYSGGVIYLDRGTDLTIKRSNFTKNSALIQGGVIYAMADNITIYDSIFNENLSHERGSVIYIHNKEDAKDSNLTIVKSSFTQNKANYSGAALFLQWHI